MSAFRKIKRPKNTQLNGTEDCTYVDQQGVCIIQLGYKKIGIGPRTAMKFSRWLERYAKWSSLN